MKIMRVERFHDDDGRTMQLTLDGHPGPVVGRTAKVQTFASLYAYTVRDQRGGTVTIASCPGVTAGDSIEFE